ncbi:MAG: glycoside hydrolase family protein [Polyangiales bacterium]
MARVKDYDALWDHIERYEGRRHKAYVCTAGHPTIGIGFNLDRADASAKLGALGFALQAVRGGDVTLTDDQVDELFEPDLATAIEGAHGLVRNFDALSARRQHACVDLTYNLGASGFGRFTKTLEAVQAGRFDEAARELQASRWFAQVGQRGPVVVAMMRDG